MILYLLKFFDVLNEFWHNRVTSNIVSTSLIVIFVLSGLTTVASNLGWMSLKTTTGYFFAIDASFTALLIFEILGLIFVLPQSVADSVGKQFEILSIILLRAAFKEFGHISPALIDSVTSYKALLPMLSDAFGALVIFIIIGFYYRLQKHERITKSDIDQKQFITFKKIISLFLLLAFLFIGVIDFRSLITSGLYDPSFNNFYTLLIFSDVLILLYSLRYKSQYINLFRYSSFAFATILIRLSLSAPPYINVIIGVVAGAFVLGLTLIYNNFREEQDYIK